MESEDWDDEKLTGLTTSKHSNMNIKQLKEAVLFLHKVAESQIQLIA